MQTLRLCPTSSRFLFFLLSSPRTDFVFLPFLPCLFYLGFPFVSVLQSIDQDPSNLQGQGNNVIGAAGSRNTVSDPDLGENFLIIWEMDDVVSLAQERVSLKGHHSLLYV
jgi:hypothetical protein